MNLFLSIQNTYDIFSFDPQVCNESKITISTPIECEKFVTFIQATLSCNKFVLIVENKNVLNNIDLNALKSNHFSIVENKFIFLNYSLKKKIEKLIDKTVSFSTYQDLESFLTPRLSTIF